MFFLNYTYQFVAQINQILKLINVTTMFYIIFNCSKRAGYPGVSLALLKTSAFRIGPQHGHQVGLKDQTLKNTLAYYTSAQYCKSFTLVITDSRIVIYYCNDCDQYYNSIVFYNPTIINYDHNACCKLKQTLQS